MPVVLPAHGRDRAWRSSATRRARRSSSSCESGRTSAGSSSTSSGRWSRGASGCQSELEHLNEAQGPIFKIANDPRVTRVGRFLRRDEPRRAAAAASTCFVGEMSLVGPRPMSVRDVNLFDRGIQRKRFSVRPGLTCLWQVSGRQQPALREVARARSLVHRALVAPARPEDPAPDDSRGVPGHGGDVGVRVAIVHDYLNQRGGAERVVAVLHEMFPEAPIFTSVLDRAALWPRAPVGGHPGLLDAAAARASAALQEVPAPLPPGVRAPGPVGVRPGPVVELGLRQGGARAARRPPRLLLPHARPLPLELRPVRRARGARSRHEIGAAAGDSDPAALGSPDR